MRISIAAVLPMALFGQAHAFEFMGVASGQSETTVSHSLSAAGYKIDQSESGQLRFSKDGAFGWATFCGPGLNQISVSKPYTEFPALLQAAVQSHGPGGLMVQPSGVSASEHYVSYHWPQAADTYSLTLIASKLAAPTEVRVTWGITKGCAPSMPNKQ